MGIRTPHCKGSPGGEERGPHGPHEYWTRGFTSWTRCTGWTQAEDDAVKLVERVRSYLPEHYGRQGLRLEVHWAVQADLHRLIEPAMGTDWSKEPSTLNALFGVPVVPAAALEPRAWRLLADGQVVAHSGEPAEQADPPPQPIVAAALVNDPPSGMAYWLDYTGARLLGPGPVDEPTGWRESDGLNHRIMRAQPGQLSQAISLCGRRVHEVPGRGPVDCQGCLQLLAEEGETP